MMNFKLHSNLIGIAAIAIATCALVLGGCGNNDGSADESDGRGEAAMVDDRDHDHEEHADHDEHDQDGEMHDEHAHEENMHDHMHEGEPRELGAVTVGGAELQVTLIGDVEPNREIHVDIIQTGGEKPAAVRLWVGDASGRGSLKSKADGHDNHFHGHAEVPATVDESTELWIEVETTAGERMAKSLAF
jgi:hypothetical protein